MRRIAIISKLLCLLVIGGLFAQNEVPVGLYTGTPSVNVPLYVIQDHDLSVPISISYSASGVKVGDKEGSFGLGWQFNGEGYVSREVNGLPDDFKDETITPVRKGWLFEYIANSVGSETFSSDGVGDWEDIDKYTYNIDTEPDVFHFSLPGGASGKFVFDAYKQPQLIPYQNLKIDVTRDANNNDRISQFTITTDEGIIYEFRNLEFISKKITGTTSSAPQFSTREYLQYLDTPVKYVSSWRLSSITSYTGATITYTYDALDEEQASERRKFYVYDNSTENTFVQSGFGIDFIFNKLRLKSIRSSSAAAAFFDYADITVNGTVIKYKEVAKVNITDERKGSDVVKSFAVHYKRITSEGTEYVRKFLHKIQESSSCSKLPPFVFEYYGVDYSNGKTLLPGSDSKAVDFWGYFNGKENTLDYPTVYINPDDINKARRYRLYPNPKKSTAEYVIKGADRAPNPNTMPIGTLEKITYPTGGKAHFIFETNTFYDDLAQATFPAGGLRIKKIIYMPQNGSDVKAIYKNYEYSANGQSSGRIINYPQFVVPVPVYKHPTTETSSISDITLSSSGGKLAHVLTAEPINEQLLTSGSVVGYKKVTISNGAGLDYAQGRAVYEYSFPAPYGTGYDFESTSVNPLINTTTKQDPPEPNHNNYNNVYYYGTYGYPFFSQGNIDFERGLLEKVTHFNSLNKKVKEKVIAYKKNYKPGLTASQKVVGINFEAVPYYTNQTFRYSNVVHFTNVRVDIDTEVNTTFTEGEATSLTKRANFFYESSYHKYPTSIITENSKLATGETTIYRQFNKYPLDYVRPGFSTASDDKEYIGLERLVNVHKVDFPIESITYKQAPGEIQESAVEAILATYSPSTNSTPLPYKKYIYNSSTGVSDFTPSSVSSGIFYHDERYYQEAETVTHYSGDKKIASVVHSDRTFKTKLYGHRNSLPVAEFVNATPEQVAFCGFEGTADRTFSIIKNTTESIAGEGRTGEKGLKNYFTLKKTISKGQKKGYVFSAWIKFDQDFSFALKFNDTAGSNISSSSISFSPGLEEWQYVQQFINVESLPATFEVEIVVNKPSSTTDLHFDDIAFYPADAEMASYTYVIPFGFSSVTDSRGNTIFSFFDDMGRLKYQTDKHGNILKVQHHKIGVTAGNFLNADFSATGEAFVNEPVIFEALNASCNDAATKYFWSVDGGISYTEGGANFTTTFSTTGSKKIYLKLVHPVYGELQELEYIDVKERPLEVTICSEGISTRDLCDVESTVYAECASIPDYINDGNTTKFKAESVNNAAGAYTIKWQQDDGSGGFMDLTDTGDLITKSSYETYIIRCIVTDAENNSAISNTIQVTYYYSSDCTSGGTDPILDPTN